MSKNLRVGILGAGFMAHTHGRRLLDLGGIEIAGVSDVSSDAARALLEDLRVEAPVFLDFEKMIRESKCDAVYVCLPPFAHNGQVELAAAAGKHLFVEKPVALTLARAESMRAAIERAGVISQVGYHFRFKKSVAKMRGLLASGEAGRPTLFDGRFWCNMEGKPWWRDAARSGGQLFEQATHLYDLAVQFMGEPDRVSGQAGNLCHEGQSDYTAEDTSLGSIRFRNGGMAAVTGSNCAIKDRFIGDFRLVCERVVLDYRSTGDWREKDVATFHFDGRSEEVIEDGDPYKEASLDFITAIREGRKASCPAGDGVRIVKLTSMVLESARQSGATLNWNP